jgi:uncharacterized protein YodC (DUF2158 family)
MSSHSVGDVVRLASGSPDLCVTAVLDEGCVDETIAVAWFTADGQLHNAEFRPEALELRPSKDDVPTGDETDLEPPKAEPCLHLVTGETEATNGIELGDGIELDDGVYPNEVIDVGDGD